MNFETFNSNLPEPKIAANKVKSLSKIDLQELCDATEEAILADGGFGWVKPPVRKKLEDFWKGVILIPERILIIGKLDNIVAGSVQLIKPARNNEAQAHLCNLSTFFLASWARGFGVAKSLFEEAQNEAKRNNFKVITLEVRETQTRAIQIYEQAGFVKCGVNPKSAFVNDRYISGFYYFKEL